MVRLDRVWLGATVNLDETYGGGTEGGTRGQQLVSKGLVRSVASLRLIQAPSGYCSD